MMIHAEIAYFLLCSSSNCFVLVYCSSCVKSDFSTCFRLVLLEPEPNLSSVRCTQLFYFALF